MARDSVAVYPILHPGLQTPPDATLGEQLAYVILLLFAGGKQGFGKHIPEAEPNTPAKQSRCNDPEAVNPGLHSGRHDEPLGVESAQAK